MKKAFQEFYCFPGSPLPRGNDFSDFTAYFVQKAIPEAMSQIRNHFGSTPLTVQKFLLDLLRYNDNSNNPVRITFIPMLELTIWESIHERGSTGYLTNISELQASDCHYVATLMKSLARTLMVVPDGDNDGYQNYDFEDQEEKDAKLTALSEVERHQRMDQWVPSYQNVISEAALEVFYIFATFCYNQLTFHSF